jgi:hypothetical protein
VGAILLVLAVLACAGVLLWFGVQLAGRGLFWENRRFTIRNLDITNESIAVREFLSGKKKIRKDANLFGFSIREVRRDFLRRAPNYKSMSITRILPDTLKIEVVERAPLARIGRRGLAADADGHVFGSASLRRSLPVLTGYRGRELKPGDRIAPGLARDALIVLDVCEKTPIGREISILSIDVRGGYSGREDALRLSVAGRITVDLWWQRSRAAGISPLDDLRGRLRYLRAILRRAEKEGKTVRSVNLAVDDYMNNARVSPRWR